jgi:hypothetical protein
VYIGARNDLEAQAYAPIIYDGHALYPSINNFYGDIREISANMMGLKKPL